MKNDAKNVAKINVQIDAENDSKDLAKLTKKFKNWAEPPAALL